MSNSDPLRHASFCRGLTAEKGDLFDMIDGLEGLGGVASERNEREGTDLLTRTDSKQL